MDGLELLDEFIFNYWEQKHVVLRDNEFGWAKDMLQCLLPNNSSLKGQHEYGLLLRIIRRVERWRNRRAARSNVVSVYDCASNDSMRNVYIGSREGIDTFAVSVLSDANKKSGCLFVIFWKVKTHSSIFVVRTTFNSYTSYSEWLWTIDRIGVMSKVPKQTLWVFFLPPSFSQIPSYYH